VRLLFTLFLVAACAANTPATAQNRLCFGDQELRDLPSHTLVYVWSPRMVYSVSNMQAASQAAAAAGLNFIALHDARVPESELPEAVAPSRALCASHLIEREALRHFPSAFVVTPRGIHAHPIVGAMPLSAWVSSIDQRLRLP
jgi:hypothetical protein